MTDADKKTEAKMGETGKPAGDARGGSAPEESTPSVEELVPGLEGAIAAEDAHSKRIEALEAELAEVKDRLLRALAETENIRRRAERDRRDAETYGGTRLARDLLAVYDNLSRAVAAADDELRDKHGPFLEGVELTQRELLNAFAKHKIVPINPEPGEKFDPNRHQSMFEVPLPGATPGTVVEVMQTGFAIADRLLRPALVGVAKAAPADEDGKTAAEGAAASGGES